MPERQEFVNWLSHGDANAYAAVQHALDAIDAAWRLLDIRSAQAMRSFLERARGGSIDGQDFMFSRARQVSIRES